MEKEGNGRNWFAKMKWRISVWIIQEKVNYFPWNLPIRPFHSNWFSSKMFWRFGSMESLMNKFKTVGFSPFWPTRGIPSCKKNWMNMCVSPKPLVDCVVYRVKKCWQDIYTCQGFITSSFSSLERPVAVSQRDPGTRISRAEFPPAKKDRCMWGRECHKLWYDITPFLSRPHEVLQDPGLRLNASYYITKQILPPLNRVFSLIGLDVFTW